MSKQRSSPPHLRGNSKVIPLIRARAAGRRAATLAVGLVLLATASGMWVDSADSQSGALLQPAGDTTVDSAFVYFPEQYTNQATEPSEHIQAF